MQVDQKGAAAADLRQCGCHVDGDGRGADASFGADERIRLAAGSGRRAMREHAQDGSFEIHRIDRIGDELVHARTHRFEEQGRIELRRHDHGARRRMLPLDERKRRRQVRLITDVDDQHVGLLGGGLRERAQLRPGERRPAHATGLERVFQLAIRRADENNVWGQAVHLYLTSRMI